MEHGLIFGMDCPQAVLIGGTEEIRSMLGNAKIFILLGSTELCVLIAFKVNIVEHNKVSVECGETLIGFFLFCRTRSRHTVLHLCIHIAYADDNMLVIPLNLHTDIDGFTVHQQTIRIDNGAVPFNFFQQSFLVHPGNKLITILFINIDQGVPSRFGEEIAPVYAVHAVIFIHPGTVFNELVCFQINVIQIEIVFRQRVDNTFVDSTCAQRLLVSRSGLLIFLSDPDNLSDIRTHTEKAQASCLIDELQLCCLKLFLISRRVRNIFRDDIWHLHGKRLLIILRKMPGCYGIKDFVVRKPHNARGVFFMRVFRKGLIAGEIHPRLRVLIKAHGRHMI